MNQLRTALDVRKVELVTEEIAKINREDAVKAEVAREIDLLVTALNQQHPSGRLDAGNLSATSGLIRFPVGHHLAFLGERVEQDRSQGDALAKEAEDTEQPATA